LLHKGGVLVRSKPRRKFGFPFFSHTHFKVGYLLGIEKESGDSVMYEGKVILVAGGTGAVGEGIVKVLAESGATVLVPSRSEDKALDALGYVEQPFRKNVFYLFGDISTEDDAEKMRDVVEAHYGQLDGMVSSLGGWWQGQSLTDISKEHWQNWMDSLLTSQFVASKTFMPVVKPGGYYTFIAGISAEDPAFSRETGPVGPAGAGLLMLSDTFALEMAGQVNVNSLVLGPVNTRVRPDWYRDDRYVDAKMVGEIIMALHLGDHAGVTGEKIHVYDIDAAHQLLDNLKTSKSAQ
jgi:NAD(P)-dependent dehydrogenase (short-subunit alcohol dehydrogenase family)